jgi:4-oxalocrotonate tautomerase
LVVQATKSVHVAPDEGGGLVPLVQITIARGRTPEQLAALGEKVTAAVTEAVGAPAGNVRVVVTECEPEHWFVGGESLAELRSSGRR